MKKILIPCLAVIGLVVTVVAEINDTPLASDLVENVTGSEQATDASASGWNTGPHRVVPKKNSSGQWVNCRIYNGPGSSDDVVLPTYSTECFYAILLAPAGWAGYFYEDVHIVQISQGLCVDHVHYGTNGSGTGYIAASRTFSC